MVVRTLRNPSNQMTTCETVLWSRKYFIQILRLVVVLLLLLLLLRNSLSRKYAALLLMLLNHTQLIHTHTHAVRLFWMSDQLVAEVATYTAHNKDKREPSMPSTGFEPAVPAIVGTGTRIDKLLHPPYLFIYLFIYLCLTTVATWTCINSTSFIPRYNFIMH